MNVEFNPILSEVGQGRIPPHFHFMFPVHIYIKGLGGHKIKFTGYRQTDTKSQEWGCFGSPDRIF